MRRKVLLLAAIFWLFLIHPSLNTKQEFRDFINQHPFSKRERITPEQIKQMPKKDRPDLAWEQEYLSTLDPALGRPAPERLDAIHQQVEQLQQVVLATPGSSASPWLERGPTNVGGRTRALLWDPNDANGTKVWAGGVTGGLWYNNNITSANSTWMAVNDFWDNIAISCIAYDPANTNTLYVGTGEGWGTASSRGGGIWKSTDAGVSWSRISSTSGFFYVNDIVVRNEGGNGVVYAAVDGNFYNGVWHGAASAGLQRSTNGGASWSQVLPNIPGASSNYVAADLELGANNRIWVGSRRTPYSASDRGGGRILYSDNGTTWTTSYTASGISNGDGRVELATAASNANYVYGMIENQNQVHSIVRTTNGGTSWTAQSEPDDDDLGIPTTDFSRGQAWYDLILAVDPNNPNTVIAGAINAHMSTNGGSSWSQISKWSNNANMGTQPYSYVHADHHNIIFKPGSSSELIFGTDGGVFWSNNISNAATSSVISPRNNGYNVTQFYAGALHPNAGSNQMLAGAQDNGTQRFTQSGLGTTTEATGGDGAFCFIDQSNPSYQITSYVYNSYWRSINGGVSFQFPRMQSDLATGKFINPTDYDDANDVLYSARTTSTINRIRNVEASPSIDFFTVSGMSSMASHLRVSPYSTSSSTLFVGTEGGDLYKITNANGTSPSATSIGAALPAGNVSCVEIGANENELLVTLKNYGVTSIWYTSNGGSSWVSKEGNLPDMPVRWALFNPNNRTEVLLATEVGIWSTQNFNAASPNWTASNSGLAHVRVDMLQIRDSDFRVMAITYGRGVFTSDGFSVPTLPTADFAANTTSPCIGETVTLSDSSTGGPTSYSWVITPATFNYVSGTSATSQNPQVQFSASGDYSVTLTVGNTQGMDSDVKSNYIKAGGASLPFTEDFEAGAAGWTVSNPDNSTTWSLYSVSGTTPGSTAAGIDNFNYSSTGELDGLISPSVDLTGYTSVNLTFSYAYRRYSNSYQDSLAVYVSPDCGATWTRVAAFQEDGSGNFVTGPDLTSLFTPSSSADWCGAAPQCPSISLDNYVGNPNVKIKIENIAGYGNNLYIDNFSVTGVISASPVANFAVNKANPCVDETVSLSDLSTNTPNTWSWSFSPATVTYMNGTQSTSQNPQVKFLQAGTYQVSLTSSNANGSDQEVKASYIQVGSNLVPSASISTALTSICAGDMVTITATPVNGGSNPTYQWKVNGNNAGTNSSVFNSSSLSNNDQVRVEMTSSATCVTAATVTSNSLQFSVQPVVTPSVNLAASSASICAGESVSFTATPVNGGNNPTYQWKLNGNNVGANSATFSAANLTNNDAVSVELSSSIPCPSASVVTSNSINMSVTAPVTPSVSVSATNQTICAGDLASFTAMPVHGGVSPTYQWKVNGLAVGGNSASFSSASLNNNDVITVEMTSSNTCVTSGLASSAGITMSVQPNVTPQVSISATATTICSGEAVTFSASSTNGGANPLYQWYVNSVSTGIPGASNTFTSSTLSNGDMVTAELTSSLACVTQSMATSPGVSIAVNAVPTVSINTIVSGTLCAGDTLPLIGSPAGGNFSGSNGLSGNQFSATTAGSGAHWIYYSYSGAGGCMGMDSIQVQVEILPQPSIIIAGNVLTCDQPGYNYQWFETQAGAIPGATGINYTPSVNGNYYVEISTVDCEMISNTVVINGINLVEFASVASASLFPNPAQEHTTLRLVALHNESVTLSLFNMVGQLLWMNKTEMQTGTNDFEINCAELPAGVYQIRCEGLSGSVVRSFEVF